MALRRRDVGPIAAVFTLALGVPVTAAYIASADTAPLSTLGVYFDGHLYVEIAKSFPLPFDARAKDYMGQAPGYPALIYLLRVVLPASWVNWGLAALLASWLPAALAAVAFYALCREIGLAPLWPSVAFSIANPTWIRVSAAPHPEGLALLCALLCFVAWLRGRPVLAVALLSLAALTRFPAILLGAPLAFGMLVGARANRLRNAALLGAPLVVFGLWNLYLFARFPRFSGIWEAHQVFWKSGPGWPFQALVEFASFGRMSLLLWATLGFYLSSIAIGLRASERDRWFLPVWVGALVLFHVSLSGELGVRALPRLTVLAWPAALLIVWRWAASLVPGRALAALSIGLGLVSIPLAERQIERTLRWQPRAQPYLERTLGRLESDEPHWVDFRAERRSRKRKR